MSFRHGKNTATFMDSLDASPYLNQADVARTSAPADVTTFGATAKAFIAGQEDATLSAAGFFDGDLGKIDDRLWALGTAGLLYPVTYCPDGGCIIGRKARILNVQETNITPSSPVSNAVSLKYSAQVSGGSHWGYVLNDQAQISAAVPGTSVDWGVAGASANGGQTNIHVTLNTRSTTTAVKLQHSTDNSVWVDLAGTAQTVPAGVAQDPTHPWGIASVYTLTITGAVNRYLRAVITPTAGTGVISAVVAFARF